jgi:4-amino-4-deoxy-L-arabinose transferase-like glycosyltransferase
VAFGALFLVVVPVALFAQWLLTFERQLWPVAGGLWLGAIVGLAILLRRFDPRDSAGTTVWEAEPDPWGRVWLLPVALGLVCSAAAGALALRRPETESFGDLAVLWVIGIALAGLGFVLVDRRHGGSPNDACRDPWRWPEVIALVALTAAACAARVVDLEHIPANLAGDEGTFGVMGLDLLEGRLGNVFGAGFFGFANLSYIPWGLSAKLLGGTVAALRLPSAVIGTAAVPATYLLARELWGRREAWVAGVLLAFGHYHLHYSRVAINNIADTVVAPLGLWLMLRGIRSRRVLPMAAAGAVFGLGWYGYFGARLAGIVAGVDLLGRATTQAGFWRAHGRQIAAAVVAAVVVMLPLLMLYVDQPEHITERSSQVGIFSSGWLAQEQVLTGRSMLSILAEQAGRSVLGFNFMLDRFLWYHPRIPLLHVVGATLLVVGLICCWLDRRDHRSLLLLLWFGLAVLFGWFLTESPPSSMRLVIVTPALALLAARGLRGLTGVGEAVFRGPRWLWSGLVGLVLAVAVVVNLHFYFRVYTPRRVFGNPSSEVATVLARSLRRAADDRPVFMLGAPELYWGFGALRYLVPNVDGGDVPPPTPGPWPEVDLSRGARFVVLPLRADDLDDLEARFPGGVATRVDSTFDGRPLYTVYSVGAEPHAETEGED